MENLEQQEQIINLGNLFVKELHLESESDTLSQWMAHFLAEKILALENSKGEEKKVVQKECFDLILKLWENRWVLSPRNRPFKHFEPIFALLEDINPDNPNDHYHRVILNGHYPELDNEPTLDSNWIKLSKEIDRVARIWIEYCLGKAMDDIDLEKTKEWSKNVKTLPKIDDVNSVNILINIKAKGNSKKDRLNEYEIKKLQKRINELENFKKLNDLILSEYKNKLQQYQ